MLGLRMDINERKRMEESLAARERDFRTLLENTPDAIVRYDLLGRRIYFNSAFARAVKLAGHRNEEVLGHTALEMPVSSPAVGIRTAETIQRVIRDGAPVEYELAVPDATGKLYQIHCRFLPEFGPDGQVVSVLNIARDITQQKLAQEQQLSHLHFLECMDRINQVLQGATDSEQMMSDALAEVLSIFNCDRAYLMYPCDPDAPRWTIPVECTKPEYPGVLARGLVLPMEPEFGKTLRLMLDANGPVKFGPGEHPMVPGVSEPFSIKCFMAMAVHPKVGSAWQFGIHQCSYERKWSPEEERLFQEIGRRIGDALSSLVTLRNLRENEGRLAEAERIAQVGYWERDFDSDRVTISDEVRLILGLAPEENINSLLAWHERWLQLLHPEDRERASEALRAVLRGEQSYDVEYRVVRPDRSVRIVRSHAETTRDDAGRTRRIFGILQDVTDRRQLEEQLRQSQKMDAIGQLAGGVAHDFNNILTSMLLQVSVGLEESTLPPEVLESLKQIRSDAERAANLTRQLLLFSRRQAMQLRDLNLNEVVTNLAKMLQRIIGEDVRLQLHPHPAPLMTHADAGMLEQLLMNLAVNARDAMPEGGNLVIETSERVVDETLAWLNPDAQPGRYTCLEVSDTGSGIRPEILPHIFEPFFTTKEPGKGTGLGLATVFGIVKQHHGWLKVYSEIGQGTTFQIYLPAGDANEAETEAAAPKPRGGTETILLAEDETSVRNTTRTILTRNGYHRCWRRPTAWRRWRCGKSIGIPLPCC
jgi:PAS domain S-box-containing protein